MCVCVVAEWGGKAGRFPQKKEENQIHLTKVFKFLKVLYYEKETDASIEETPIM